MRAAAFSSYGSPDVLRVMELDDPQASFEQVRVRIKAAGVQPFDCAVRNGWTAPGQTVSFPQILGNEFAGIIDQVEEGVTNFSAGDEVLGWALMACYAEYAVVYYVDQIVKKPQEMSREHAGVISAAGQTAHNPLRELSVSKGDTLLIHAATGGVGSFAVQLAQAWGATVALPAFTITTTCVLLGAIPVTYGDGLVDRIRSLAPEGIDVALDASGSEALRTSVEVANKDRIGTIVAFDLVEELGVRPIRSHRSTDRLSELVDLYFDGKITVHVRRTFRLDEAANAHREIETEHGRGKVVLTID